MAEEEQSIELEKHYSFKVAANKLRRLADALDAEKSFYIQIKGERIRVPPHAIVEIEYEKVGDSEELEFEIKWKSNLS